MWLVTTELDSTDIEIFCQFRKFIPAVCALCAVLAESIYCMWKLRKREEREGEQIVHLKLRIKILKIHNLKSIKISKDSSDIQSFGNNIKIISFAGLSAYLI